MIILNKLFIAFCISIVYTFVSFIINYGLHRIKNKELPNSFTEDFIYNFITNLILIFVLLLIFKIEV